MKYPIYGLLALLLTACQSTPEPKALTLTLLHINDHHSHLEGHHLRLPTAGLELEATNDSGQTPTSVRIAYGGYPRLSALARKLSEGPRNQLRLHAGDAITGTPYFSEFEGEADAALMNHFCFDAYVLGNHEFDHGDAGLARFLEFLGQGDCPPDVLAANVVPGPGSPLRDHPLKPYALYDFDGRTVAVIGLNIAHKTRLSSNPDPETRFLDEVDTAQRTIDELTQQGIDKIVLLTHYQYYNDRELAGELRGVDVIVGGDSHTLLGRPELKALGFDPEGPYPTRVKSWAGEPVCIVQAWDYSRALGQLTVEFDRNGRVTGCDGRPVFPLDPKMTYESTPGTWLPLNVKDRQTVRDSVADMPEVRWVDADPYALAVLAPYREELAGLQEAVIGELADTLCQVRLPGGADCASDGHLPQGSPVVTLVAQSFLRAVPEADIALQNAGGVRTHLYRGNVSRADLQKLLPFDNTLVTLELTGEELDRALEQAVDYALSSTGSAGGYPYGAGIRFRVDSDGDIGQRVSALEVNPQLAGDWQPVVADRRYRLVVNSFIAEGGDGYRLLADKTAQQKDTGIHYARPLAEWFQQALSNGAPLYRPDAATFSTHRFD